MDIIIQGTTQIQVSGPSQQAPVTVGVSPGLGASVIYNGTDCEIDGGDSTFEPSCGPTSSSLVGAVGINPIVAGDHIAVQTTVDGIVIDSLAAVYSVAGKTGDVALSSSDIQDGVYSVAGRTGIVSLTSDDLSDFTTALSQLSPVLSVSGKTGNVNLDISDINLLQDELTANLPQVLSVAGRTGDVVIAANDVSGLSSAIQAASPVTSVAGRTGDIVLSVNDISGLEGGSSGVSSVNGKTGVVVLTAADVTAAAASHTHNYVQSVNGKTGIVSLFASDVSAAAASHSHDYVLSLNSVTGPVTLQQGAGISITSDGQASQITITATGGGSGGSLSIWPSLILGG